MGEIEIGEYIIEWDDEKAEINWKKHKIKFNKKCYQKRKGGLLWAVL